jgi:methylamine dehydrogenase heavy chain
VERSLSKQSTQKVPLQRHGVHREFQCRQLEAANVKLSSLIGRLGHLRCAASALVQSFQLCCLGAGWTAALAAAPAGQGSPEPAILETETSDVAVLPPPGPHRVLVGSSFEARGVHVIDGDSGKLQGEIYTAAGANFAIDPNNTYYYVAETYWSHGNRGKRDDLLSIYDDQLKLVAEIALPGRLISTPKSPTLAVSGDGRWAYVYDLQPAASVAVVDLSMHKLAAVVEIPGCGMVYAWRSAGFSSLCADGTAATVSRQDAKYTVSHSERFFDAELDPVFEESLVDRSAEHAFFISYTGVVHEAQLGEHFQILRHWSLQQAAQLAPATTSALEYTWRPGGAHFAAYHKATGRLFVLMHVGAHWSHKQSGTEIWVFDTQRQLRIARLAIPAPADAITVSQDAEPLLYVLTGRDVGEAENQLAILNAQSGEVVRTVKGVSGSFAAVKGF